VSFCKHNVSPEEDVILEESIKEKYSESGTLTEIKSEGVRTETTIKSEDDNKEKEDRMRERKDKEKIMSMKEMRIIKTREAYFRGEEQDKQEGKEQPTNKTKDKINSVTEFQKIKGSIILKAESTNTYTPQIKNPVNRKKENIPKINVIEDNNDSTNIKVYQIKPVKSANNRESSFFLPIKIFSFKEIQSYQKLQPNLFHEKLFAQQ